MVGRIFYPAAKAEAATRWGLLRRGIPWAPQWQYARGLGRFLFFRSRGVAYRALQGLITCLAWTLGNLATLDMAAPGAPLATPGTDPDGAPDHLPVLLFSHGLSGHRSACVAGRGGVWHDCCLVRDQRSTGKCPGISYLTSLPRPRCPLAGWPSHSVPPTHPAPLSPPASHVRSYSLICGEIASQGYVVLALEHMDGTACAARLPSAGAGGSTWLM